MAISREEPDGPFMCCELCAPLFGLLYSGLFGSTRAFERHGRRRKKERRKGESDLLEMGCAPSHAEGRLRTGRGSIFKAGPWPECSSHWSAKRAQSWLAVHEIIQPGSPSSHSRLGKRRLLVEQHVIVAKEATPEHEASSLPQNSNRNPPKQTAVLPAISQRSRTIAGTAFSRLWSHIAYGACSRPTPAPRVLYFTWNS